MTKQEIINKIQTEFKGKALTTSLSEACVYLTEDGKKCAIGLFIPDGHEAQTKQMTVNSLLKYHPELKEYMPFDNINKLMFLQDFHDNKLDEDMSLQEQKDLLIKEVEKLC